MLVADPNSPPSGRAVGGGGAPDLRRPSQRWKAPPPGMPFRQPHTEQRRPAGAHAVGPVLGPHARTDRTRDTRVAEPRLPAPGGGSQGEGQRLTPDAPHNSGRPTPPGTAPHHPRGTQPPQGNQAKGTVLGPHTHTPAPTACGWRTPTARPVGGQFRERERLTTDTPHNGGRHPPGNALPPPPQRATPARRHARCGAGAGSPLLHRPHPGHTGRGTPATRPRGRTAGEGTGPDTRRPSQPSQATPPGDGPPPSPRHAAPTGHAGQGDSVGPPHPHTRAHSTWVADPNSPPSGRAVGGGTAPDLRRPSQWWKAPPPGTPFCQPHSEQRRPAGAHAVGPVLGPTPAPTAPWTHGSRNLAASPRGRGAGGGTAPDTRHSSERWQATPPGDGPPSPPRHTAPTGHAGQGDSVGPPHPHTHAHSTWVADLNSPPSGRAVGGGGAPDLRRPSQRWKAAPPGTPFRHPHSEQRRPAGAHAVGPVLGPHARTDRTRDTRVAEPRLPAPEDGRPGEGQRLTPDAPHNSGRPPPPGTAPHHPRGTQPPQGKQAKGTVLGPHTHTPAPTACAWRTPTARPVGGQFRERERLTTDTPHNGGRHPPGNALPPPPQRATPARRHARCGAGAGSPRPHRPHPGHMGCGTPAIRPRGRTAGEGTGPDTRRPSQPWQATPPGDGPPPPPRHAAPTGHAGQGDSVRPRHPHTRAHSTLVADPNSPPSGRAVGGGTAPDLRRPSQWWKAPPPGTPFRQPHSEQRRPARAHAVGPVLGPTPAPTAPWTHGSQNLAASPR